MYSLYLISFTQRHYFPIRPWFCMFRQPFSGWVIFHCLKGRNVDLQEYFVLFPFKKFCGVFLVCFIFILKVSDEVVFFFSFENVL